MHQKYRIMQFLEEQFILLTLLIPFTKQLVYTNTLSDHSQQNFVNFTNKRDKIFK